jgi:hypothetical protein
MILFSHKEENGSNVKLKLVVQSSLESSTLVLPLDRRSQMNAHQVDAHCIDDCCDGRIQRPTICDIVFNSSNRPPCKGDDVTVDAICGVVDECADDLVSICVESLLGGFERPCSGGEIHMSNVSTRRCEITDQLVSLGFDHCETRGDHVVQLVQLHSSHTKMAVTNSISQNSFAYHKQLNSDYVYIDIRKFSKITRTCSHHRGRFNLPVAVNGSIIQIKSRNPLAGRLISSSSSSSSSTSSTSSSSSRSSSSSIFFLKLLVSLNRAREDLHRVLVPCFRACAEVNEVGVTRSNPRPTVTKNQGYDRGLEEISRSFGTNLYRVSCGERISVMLLSTKYIVGV